MRKIGIDGNLPLDNAGNIRPTVQPDLVAATGTGYVRVNFVLGPYDSPRNENWQNRFDSIIDGLRAKGIEIYGLIGHESVRTPLDDKCSGEAPNSEAEAWIAEYVDNFDTIVEHFQGRVEFFESFNEPNNWAPGRQSALVHSYWMAKMLREIYQRVKIQNKRQVTLVSGPIFTHKVDSGKDYIEHYFTLGRNQHGWDEFRAQHGTFPLDGLGLHIYIDEPDPAVTARACRKRVDQIWTVFTGYEGANTSKRLFISEFGWQSSSRGEDYKAQCINVVLPLLRSDWRVRLASLFCMQGWFGEGGSEQFWGIYRPSGLEPGDRELAYRVFRAQAELDKQEPGTIQPPSIAPPFALGEIEVTPWPYSVEWLEPRGSARVAPGQALKLRFRLRNTGTKTWETTGPQPVNLAYRWVKLGGQLEEGWDAFRVSLPHDVAPGQEVILSEAVIRAPSTSGDYMLRCDLVEEGLTWFSREGATPLELSIQVFEKEMP